MGKQQMRIYSLVNIADNCTQADNQVGTNTCMEQSS